MARDILGDYGRDTPQPQRARATNGGRLETRDVRNYQAPVGPKSINDPKSPGLHGENYGNAPCQGRH